MTALPAESFRWWAILMVTGAIVMFLGILVGFVFIPEYSVTYSGGFALFIDGMPIFFGGGLVMGGWYLFLLGSPTLNGNGERYTTSYPNAIDLGSLPVGIIDPEKIAKDLSPKEREKLAAITKMKAGAYSTGQAIPYRVRPMGGGSKPEWGLSTPFAYGSGAYIERGNFRSIQMGTETWLPFGIESRSQSNFSEDMLTKLAERKRPRGFRLGPNGTRMFTHGARLLKPVEDWVRGCPEVHQAVADQWGLPGIAKMFVGYLEDEIRASGKSAFLTSEIKDFVTQRFIDWLEAKNGPLKVAIGGGTEDLTSLLTDKFALQTSLTQARAEKRLFESENFKLRLRLHGNVDRRSSLLPGASSKSATQLAVGERTEGTER